MEFCSITTCEHAIRAAFVLGVLTTGSTLLVLEAVWRLVREVR